LYSVETIGIPRSFLERVVRCYTLFAAMGKPPYPPDRNVFRDDYRPVIKSGPGKCRI